jgi:transcriptional regulator with XRE-family HTH domain
MLSEERRKTNKDSLGAMLKQARTDADFTQKALADALGLEYYTMVSQMELGYISIPASLWVPLAQTLHIDQTEWVTRCLVEYQPDLFYALFGKRGRTEVAQILDLFRKGKLDDFL